MLLAGLPDGASEQDAKENRRHRRGSRATALRKKELLFVGVFIVLLLFTLRDVYTLLSLYNCVLLCLSEALSQFYIICTSIPILRSLRSLVWGY